MKIFSRLFTVFLISGLIAINPAQATPMIPIDEVFEPPAPQDPQNYMKIAVIQWNPYQSAPVGAPQSVADIYMKTNREDMQRKIEEAVKNKAQFIVLSEFATVGYPDVPELPSEEDEFLTREQIKPFLDTVPGVASDFFAALAIEHKVWIQFGMAELETATDKYFNTAVVLNPEGKIAASFRKMTLFNQEHDFLSAGEGPVTFDSPVGKVGILICADVYNYSLLQSYKSMKVDVLSLSTSWASMNTGMSTFKSAAMSVGSYLLAANQTYFPDSGVINPDGTTQSHIRQSGDAIAYGYLPLKPSTPPPETQQSN